MHKTRWHTSEQSFMQIVRHAISAIIIRTTEDAERAWIRIAVARTEVVRQEILELDMTLSKIVWAGGTGGARRQPATYGIVAQGHWSAIAVIWH